MVEYLEKSPINRKTYFGNFKASAVVDMGATCVTPLVCTGLPAASLEDVPEQPAKDKAAMASANAAEKNRFILFSS